MTDKLMKLAEMWAEMGKLIQEMTGSDECPRCPKCEGPMFRYDPLGNDPRWFCRNLSDTYATCLGYVGFRRGWQPKGHEDEGPHESVTNDKV